MNSFSFSIYVEVSSTSFWSISIGMEFQGDHFSFHSFKHVTTLSSFLNYCGSNFVSLYMVLFFSGCFEDFSFAWLIWLWCSLDVEFSSYFVLGFHWIDSVDTGFVVPFKVESFMAIVFVRYLSVSPLFYFWNLSCIYIILLHTCQASQSCSTAHWRPFYFLPSFFILDMYFSLLIFSFMLFDVFLFSQLR